VSVHTVPIEDAEDCMRRLIVEVCDSNESVLIYLARIELNIALLSTGSHRLKRPHWTGNLSNLRLGLLRRRGRARAPRRLVQWRCRPEHVLP